MLSYALGLALFVLSLRAIVAVPGGGWPVRFFEYISMSEHMENFARGVIDTRPSTFYMSGTALTKAALSGIEAGRTAVARSTSASSGT